MGFLDAVTEQDDGVARLKLEFVDLVGGLFQHADGEAVGFENVDFRADALAWTHQEGAGVACVRIPDQAVGRDFAGEDGAILFALGTFYQELVEARDPGFQRGAGCGGLHDDALKQGRQQGSGYPFAGHVGDGGKITATGARNDIEEVSTDLMSGYRGSDDFEESTFGQMLGEQALLNRPGEGEFLFEAMALAFFFKKAGVFENGTGLEGEGLEEFAISFLGGGLVQARVHVEDSDGVVKSGGHGFAGVGGAAAQSNDRDAEHAAEVEAVEGVVEAAGPIGEWVEVEAEEFLAFLEGTLDESGGDGEVFRREGAAGLVAPDGYRELAGRFEDEEATFHVGDGEGGFDDGGEDVFGGEGMFEAAGDFGEGAEFRKFAGPLGAGCGAGKAAQELSDFGFVLFREDEAVAVLEPKVYGVARV